MGRRFGRVAILGATALVLGLFAAPGAQAQSTDSCFDLATFSEVPATIVGTNSSEVLRGISGRGVIAGLDDDDGIGGEGGRDLIDAGAGNDFATGQMAGDIVSGSDGNDELFGGPANDLVRGGDGNDFLVGNFGNDLLLGGRGDDEFVGDAFGAPEPPSFDICNGQQGTDLAVPDTCELEIQIEGDFVPPTGG